MFKLKERLAHRGKDSVSSGGVIQVRTQMKTPTDSNDDGAEVANNLAGILTDVDLADKFGSSLSSLPTDSVSN